MREYWPVARGEEPVQVVAQGDPQVEQRGRRDPCRHRGERQVEEQRDRGEPQVADQVRERERAKRRPGTRLLRQRPRAVEAHEAPQAAPAARSPAARRPRSAQAPEQRAHALGRLGERGACGPPPRRAPVPRPPPRRARACRRSPHGAAESSASVSFSPGPRRGRRTGPRGRGGQLLVELSAACATSSPLLPRPTSSTCHGASGHWPDDPLLVGALLDRGRDDPRGPDPVAPITIGCSAPDSSR